MENIHEHIFNAFKDSLERKTYLSPNFVANVEKISIVFTIEKRGQKTIKIHTLRKTKERIFIFYAFSEMGRKLHPKVSKKII